MRHGRRVRGQGDNAFVAGESFAQPGQLALSVAQVGRQPGGKHQHDHHGNQEVHAQAPEQQGMGVDVAAPGLAEEGRGGIAGTTRHRRRQRPVTR
ncbi:hypothetical protein G6F65_022142 [Rhizopus arrhizus]|nr:hypothetical protein G6F65_022142 [Rhizopus arrhizus]